MINKWRNSLLVITLISCHHFVVLLLLSLFYTLEVKENASESFPELFYSHHLYSLFAITQLKWHSDWLDNLSTWLSHSSSNSNEVLVETLETQELNRNQYV